MRKFILATLLCAAAISGAMAQGNDARKFSFATTVGTGIPLGGGPAHFSWQALGYYNLTEHWALGAGTGLSFYEKALIPVFGDVRYRIGRERRFTPYAEAAAGYSFAPDSNANGGVFINPSVGVRYRLNERLGLQLAAGLEIQGLERLRTHSDNYFHKEFAEELSHNMISVRFGLSF